ncbi:MAG TPA: hypothetical protein VKZ87_13435 [Ferrovibrio sp.]|jgi:predicted transcriptional regulator|uniref:HVO_A0114 family putative DNA-binding protein n=1 Tax=Ferrovibrio sp. TaxID=1917215 RepID=UPI002B4ABA91|nr:hypothetical protein [Ferrovibrio sp.]HLT78381.1 hypothetical protein [Ferrovibrio sp.]
MSRKKAIVSITAGKITAADIRRDFLKAMKRAEAGDLTPEYRLQFESWESLVQTLTPKRLELIRYVRKHPVRRVTELARGLKRDYRNVHSDVAALSEAGLLEKTEQGFRAPFDRIATEITLN